MKQTFLSTRAAIALTAIILTVTPAFAAPAGFAEGVQAYNARNYRQALSRFQQAAAVAPADTAVHYYLGLCYQGMNQFSLAQKQFEWVASAGSVPAYRAQAAAALQNLARYSRTYSGAAPAALPASASAAVPSGKVTAAKSSGPAKYTGKMTVYDFYTDWCGPCKRFEPVWEETARRMKDVQFKRLNAEEDANAALVQKYHIDRYPTVIYTDSSGNELDRSSGFTSEEDFSSYIRKLQGKS